MLGTGNVATCFPLVPEKRYTVSCCVWHSGADASFVTGWIGNFTGEVSRGVHRAALQAGDPWALVS